MNHGILMRYIALLPLAISVATVAHAQSEKELLRRADTLVMRGSYEEATAILDRVVARSPGNSAYLLARGRSHAAFRQYDKARQDYLAALAVDPECTLCLIDLASVEAVTLNPRSALELLNRTLDLRKTLDPARTAEAHHLRAQVHEVLGNRVDALFDYNRAIQLDPNNADYHISRGMFHLLGGAPEEALRNMNAAVKAAPTIAKPYFYRARYYATVNAYDKAIADLNRCIALDPADPNSYLARGAIHTSTGRLREAVSDFDTVIARSPSSAEAYHNRAIARYELEDIDGSCTDSRRALELLSETGADPVMLAETERDLAHHCDPAASGYYYQRGIAEYNRKNFERAIGFYDQGLKRFPHDPMLLYLRGNAALAAGRFPDAAHDYEQVLASKDVFLDEITGASAEGSDDAGSDAERQLRATSLMSIHHGLFEARHALKDYDGALAALDAALAIAIQEKRPNLDRFYLERGSLLLLKNEHAAALNDLDQAISLNPAFAPAHLFRALALLGEHPSRLQLSSFDMGATDRPQARLEIPAEPRSAEHAQRILEEARLACNRAIELDPNLGHAHLVRGYIGILAGTNDHCLDLRRARELNVPEASSLLKTNCR